MKHFVKYLVFFTLSGACGGEEGLAPDFGAGYFPVKKGTYQVYDVEEIRYLGGSPEKLNYEMMTRIVDSFPSANGTYTHVIHRSRRSGESDAWEALDTWSTRKAEREVVVSEGNIPFVKVKFPVREDIRWDGNAFNSLGADEYEITEVRRPMELNGMIFDQTMTVEQERNEDFIVYRDERKEIYAIGAGLIYKEVLQLNYCTDDHCLGQQIINDGIEIKMVIKEYGE